MYYLQIGSSETISIEMNWNYLWFTLANLWKIIGGLVNLWKFISQTPTQFVANSFVILSLSISISHTHQGPSE